MVSSSDFSEEIEAQRDKVAQDDSQEVAGSPSPPAPKTPFLSILPGPGSRCDFSSQFPLSSYQVSPHQYRVVSEGQPHFSSFSLPPRLHSLPTGSFS